MKYDYLMKAAGYCNRVIMLPNVDEDKQNDMIVDALNLYLQIDIGVKDMSNNEKITF